MRLKNIWGKLTFLLLRNKHRRVSLMTWKLFFFFINNFLLLISYCIWNPCTANCELQKNAFFFDCFQPYSATAAVFYCLSLLCLTVQSFVTPTQWPPRSSQKFFVWEAQSSCLFVPQMHVGHVVTTSPPFSTIPSTVYVGVRLLAPLCATAVLIVKAQYITRHLTHSPRQLLLVTECTEPAQRETQRVWGGKNSQLKSKASGPV